MSRLDFRYCADILVEAATALKIGIGEKGLNTDELAATDANRLPMIPGTALCGVLRHHFEESEAKNLFGFQDRKEGTGSRLIVTDARFVGKEGEVMDGLQRIDFNSDEFYSKFMKMATREHCRINHRGVADKEERGKFDSQAVFKGCRFVFAIELIGAKEDESRWENTIEKLSSPLFRIGSGTRKGFGELKIIALDTDICNLSDPDGLTRYLNRSSRLRIPKTEYKQNNKDTEFLTHYVLNLKPDNFFMFSSGFGDTEVDAVAKKEIYVEWDQNIPRFSQEKILIPATSVKGAISHRTAFYYNRLTDVFADDLQDAQALSNYVGENNAAVAALFGSAKDDQKGCRGRVIISDLYVDHWSEKIFNHVAIDRFTGGAIDGALFDEKVTASQEEFKLNVVVENTAFNSQDDPHIQTAFEMVLKDITTGMLPLGGSVNRGHGCFNGTVFRNGEEL